MDAAFGSALHFTSPVLMLLNQIVERVKPDERGELASYIPELTRVDPGLFGVCLATADGHVYALGDCEHAFTIQSISKAFVYGLALEDHGEDAVLQRVGVEPSGEAFNAIVFDERSNRPFNPMVNSGAIATTALVDGADFGHRLGRILEMFQAYAGRPLAIDEAVFTSERATGHRNRAIAYLELNFGMIDERVDDHLDLYFKQCSILVTTRDLAMMAATLANNGVNPLTQKRAVSERYVRSILSVMTSCGMYDSSGEWTFRVGLPAKSGVGGGIIAVLPGQFGIGVFSPRLDPTGNSVRGVRVCQELSARFGLHAFDVQRTAATNLRHRYGGDQVCSKRRRTPSAQAALNRAAAAIRIYDLQGRLYFSAVEHVLHAVEEDVAQASYFILSGKRVTGLDASGRCLLIAARDMLANQGKRLVFAQFPTDVQVALERNDTGAWPQPSFFADLDRAIEWAENQLLAAGSAPADTGDDGGTMPLREMELAHGLNAAELAELAQVTALRCFAAGEIIFHEGDPADAVYMLASGRADIYLCIDCEQRQKRLATLEPGLTFGELALLEGGTRIADVVAAEAAQCYVLPIAMIDVLTARCPEATIKLLKNIGRSVAARLRHANSEIRALED